MMKKLYFVSFVVGMIFMSASNASVVTDQCFDKIKPQFKGRKILDVQTYGSGAQVGRHVTGDFFVKFTVKGANTKKKLPNGQRDYEDFQCDFDKTGKMKSDSWTKKQEQDKKDAILIAKVKKHKEVGKSLAAKYNS